MIPGAIPDAYPLDLPSGCILYYDFQETSSASGATIIDHSGCGNHGTNDGTLSQVGPNGRVRYFDGTDDTIATSYRFLGPWDFSIVFWFKMEAGGGVKDKWFTQGPDCALYWWDGDDDGKLLFSITDVGDGAESAASSVLLNQWTMGALTVENLDTDDQTVNFYVDGKLSGVANQNLRGEIPDAVTVVGGRTAVHAKGELGRTMVVDRVMNATEIANLYRQDAWRYGLNG